MATVTFDKEITILSHDVQLVENPVDRSKTITFLENASYELKSSDSDVLGNIGTKVIAVDGIDKTSPTAKVEYSTINLTDQPVTVKLNPSEPITILNNEGTDTYTFNDNGSFTFEFEDRAGNKGEKTATVSWIATLPQYDIKYSTTKPTNQNVEVTLKIEDRYKIINNASSNEYTFIENGEFNFQYIDNKGNVGLIHINID